MPLGFRREMAGVRNAQLAVGQGAGQAAGRRTGTVAPVGLRHPRPGGQPRAEPDELQPPHRRPTRRSRPWPRPTKPTPITLDVLLQAQQQSGPGRKRLLPRAGRLQQVDRPGPLPQGLAAGVQWRLPGRRAVAGQGLLRRPPPRPGPRRLDVPRLRLHAAEGHQPRADRAAGGRRRTCSRAARSDDACRRQPPTVRRAEPSQRRNRCPTPSAEPSAAPVEPTRRRSRCGGAAGRRPCGSARTKRTAATSPATTARDRRRARRRRTSRCRRLGRRGKGQQP